MSLQELETQADGIKISMDLDHSASSHIDQENAFLANITDDQEKELKDKKSSLKQCMDSSLTIEGTQDHTNQKEIDQLNDLITSSYTRQLKVAGIIHEEITNLAKECDFKFQRVELT